jgi:hypothetical protein
LAVTATLVKKFKFGNGFVALADLAFDNSYPTNGEAITIPSLPVINEIYFPQCSGYLFEYVKSTGKVKVYTPSGAANAHTHAVALDGGSTAAGAAHTHVFSGTAAAQKPAYVVEEPVTVTANVGTLAHIPLYITAVHVTAATSVTGAFSVIPVGETPATKQVAVNFVTGAMTFLGTDGVTAAKVSYIPKRSAGYLSAVTVDEVVVASASKVNLAARAGLIQYVWDDTDGVLVDFEQPGAAPSATHFCTVDILDTADTSIDSHADDATNSLKVTYVPYTQIPTGCFIDDADITLSSENYNFTETAHYAKTLIPAFGVNAIGETGAAARAAAIWEGPSGTAANGIAVLNPALNKILTKNTTAMTIITVPWMILDTEQLTPIASAGTNANESTHTHGPGTLVDAASGSGGAVSAAAASEVTNTGDLSALTAVRVIAFGY